MLRRLLALAVLGMALVKTLLSRWSREQSALNAFAEAYGSEGLLAVSLDERKVLDRAGRCTGCGRCDAQEGARIAASAGAYRGISYFMQSGVRSMSDYRLAAKQVECVPEVALRLAEAACPYGVPIVELSNLVRTHAARR